MQMPIEEVYEGLQQEGAMIGKPVTFIRFGASAMIDARDVIKLVKGFGNTIVYLCAVEGVDPLHVRREFLEDLVELLYAHRFSIVIETDAKTIPGSILRDLVSGWEVVPALGSITPEQLDMFVKYIRIRMQFRLNIRHEQDVASVRDLLEYVNDYPITLSARGDQYNDVNALYEDTRGMFKGYDVRYL